MNKELLQQALDAPGCERIKDFYSVGPVQRAAVESFVEALAQQEQPASVDAYVGAREDAAIWKKRALEAEELNRKFIADVNGPTYLGEPAQQEQPAQEPVAWLHGTTFQVVVSKNRPNSLAAWLPLFAHPAPTQPALSESVIEELAVKHEAFGFGRVDAKGFTTHGFDPDGLLAFAKELIEAHCRGGAK